MKQRHSTNKQMSRGADDRGSAIIIVLAVLAVFSLMVWQLSAGTESLAREAKTQAVRSELKYAAESAAARAFWLHFCEPRRQATSGPTDAQDAAAYRPDTWPADSRHRNLRVGEFEADIRIEDANAGIDVSGYRSSEQLHAYLLAGNADGVDGVAVAGNVMDLLRDYVDRNDRDATRFSGMEAPEYAARGYPHMPRNGSMQFREEILWMPGIDAVLPLERDALGILRDDLVGQLRVIPPKYERFPGVARPSFFASSPTVLRVHGGFTDLELEDVLAARRRMQREDIALPELLEPELVSRVRRHFSLAESGVATITVRVRNDDRGVTRTLRVTRNTTQMERTVRDRPQFIQNWEKLFL